MPRLSVRQFVNLAGLFALTSGLVHAASSHVNLIHVPGGGIQPQVLVDVSGIAHLVYLKGDPKASDVFYSNFSTNNSAFSPSIQVNSRQGDAIALGTIRGAQMALGKNGRIHVVWNGNESPANAKHPGSPLWYTRMKDGGTAFEPERDIMTYSSALDGGGSVAADQTGNVYAVFHARSEDSVDGEDGRALYIARSSDDGLHFGPESPAVLEGSPGICGCCGLKAWTDTPGSLFVMLRLAAAMTNRDEVLAISKDQGRSFHFAARDPWTSATCPMSSAFISAGAGNGKFLAAWETANQVRFSIVQPALGSSTIISPPGEGARKHPVATQNQRGEILLVWTEDTGWEKGGSVAWQMFDSNGRPLAEKGKVKGVPVWSMATAYADLAGSFFIIY